MKKNNNEGNSIKEVRDWKSKVSKDVSKLRGKKLVEYFNKGINFNKTKKAA